MKEVVFAQCVSLVKVVGHVDDSLIVTVCWGAGCCDHQFAHHSFEVADGYVVHVPNRSSSPLWILLEVSTENGEEFRVFW